jgi:hypothetical protein
LQILDTAKCRFPVLLKLDSDEAIIGITGGIAALGKAGLIAGLLQFQVQDALLVVLSLLVHPLSLQCGLNGHWLYRP